MYVYTACVEFVGDFTLLCTTSHVQEVVIMQTPAENVVLKQARRRPHVRSSLLLILLANPMKC